MQYSRVDFEANLVDGEIPKFILERFNLVGIVSRIWTNIVSLFFLVMVFKASYVPEMKGWGEKFSLLVFFLGSTFLLQVYITGEREKSAARKERLYYCLAEFCEMMGFTGGTAWIDPLTEEIFSEHRLLDVAGKKILLWADAVKKIEKGEISIAVRIQLQEILASEKYSDREDAIEKIASPELKARVRRLLELGKELGIFSQNLLAEDVYFGSFTPRGMIVMESVNIEKN